MPYRKLNPDSLFGLGCLLIFAAPAAWAGWQIVIKEHNGTSLTVRRCEARTPSMALYTEPTVTIECTADVIFRSGF